MKSLKVVFLIIVVSALLRLAYGMEKIEATRDPYDARATMDLLIASQTPQEDPFGAWYGAAGGGAGILVIPTAEADELVTTASKDLNIMCRIFDKELRLGATGSTFENGLSFSTVYRSGMRYGLASGPRGRNASCMYLQGHAAVFLMSVDFPLAPGPEDANVKPEEPNEPADVVWHQAQQELYGPRNPSKNQKDPANKYDPERVNAFEADLLKTLKHAANIRCIGDAEWVVAVVWGPGSASATPRTLVVRAKKTDVAGLSEGTLTLEQFRDKAQIFTLPGDTRPWTP